MNKTSFFGSSDSLPSTNFEAPSALSFVTRTSDAISPAVLRWTLAGVLFPHGAQKLIGLFGGYGFRGTMAFFTDTMRIPWLLAFGVILIEFFAPLMLLLGVGTRLAALGIGVVMASAMLMVHSQNGFFMNWFGNQKGEGIEYFLLILGIVLSLLMSGGGRWSIDRAAQKGGGNR